MRLNGSKPEHSTAAKESVTQKEIEDTLVSILILDIGLILTQLAGLGIGDHRSI